MPNDIQYKEMNGIALAYLGDCVIELEVRKLLLRFGIYDSLSLNKYALMFVKASAQSAALSNIEGILNETELAYYKRGRNTHTSKTPKSSTAVEYRRATGFESLFAYLYLENKLDRLELLFNAAYKDVINSLKQIIKG